MQIQFTEKPTVEISPNPYPTLMKGDKLTLTCKVSESTSQTKWKKNGGSVSSKAVTKDGDKISTLVIEKVDTDDSGDYSCEAQFQAGFASSTVEIKVRGEMALVEIILQLCQLLYRKSTRLVQNIPRYCTFGYFYCRKPVLHFFFTARAIQNLSHFLEKSFPFFESVFVCNTSPTGSSKYSTTRKNALRYYTPKHLIRYMYYSGSCSAQKATLFN